MLVKLTQGGRGVKCEDSWRKELIYNNNNINNNNSNNNNITSCIAKTKNKGENRVENKTKIFPDFKQKVFSKHLRNV